MGKNLRFEREPIYSSFTFIEHTLSQVIMIENSEKAEKIVLVVREIVKAESDLLGLFGETRHLESVTRELRVYQSVLSVPILERSRFCMMAWKPGKFRLLAKYSLDLTIHALNETESLGMICKLRHKSGKDLYVCIAQLAPDRSGKAQLIQLKGFLGVIREICNPNCSILISGNFNITPNSGLYNLFKGNLMLETSDLTNLAGHTPHNLMYRELANLAYSFSLKWEGNSAHFKRKRQNGPNQRLSGMDATNAFEMFLNSKDIPTFFTRNFNFTCDYLFSRHLQTIDVLDNSNFLSLIPEYEHEHLPIGASLRFKN